MKTPDRTIASDVRNVIFHRTDQARLSYSKVFLSFLNQMPSLSDKETLLFVNFVPLKVVHFLGYDCTAIVHSNPNNSEICVNWRLLTIFHLFKFIFC